MKLRTKIGLLAAFATTSQLAAAQATPTPTPTPAYTPPAQDLARPLQTFDQISPDYIGEIDTRNVRGSVTVDATPKPGDFDEAPRVIEKAAPRYPVTVLRLAMAGDVRLDILVDTEGHPREPRVSVSPRPEFEAAAVEAALQWKFKPAMKHGQPVAARFDLTVHFKITHTDNGLEAVAFAAPSTAPRDYPAEFQYDQAPDVRLTAPAVYPFELATKNTSGSATVVFLIDPLGRPRRVEVRESTQPEFGAATAAMISAWRFTPARKNGKPTWTMLAKKQTFDPVNGDSVLGESATRLVGDLKRNPSPILEGTAVLDAAPKARYQVAPTLPEALVAAGKAAEAEIEIIIDRTGRVQLPRIASATHEDFGWAAATAVARWQFTPPTQNGKPVDVRLRVPLAYDPPAKSAAAASAPPPPR